MGVLLEFIRNYFDNVKFQENSLPSRGRAGGGVINVTWSNYSGIRRKKSEIEVVQPQFRVLFPWA